jgi:hypothetical protein
MLLAAPPLPPVIIAVDPALDVGAQAAAAWQEFAARWEEATGAAVSGSALTIHIAIATGLPGSEAGQSAPGRIALRPGLSGERRALAVRHEIAHQLLWEACPQGAEDRFFHEAFAIAMSGELDAWTDAGYLSVAQARSLLSKSRSLDTTDARRGIARLLANDPSPLPQALVRRMRACADGAPWRGPMTVAELNDTPLESAADSFVVLSRHSGEVLASEGDAGIPMPFGSTLKPFVVAGATGTAPVLPRDPARAEWACGDAMPDAIGVEAALLRSCNGYFLDWAKKDPSISRFGAFGPLLLDLGLARLPSSAPEAIGLRPDLALSPWSVASAYRVLSIARPDLVKTLQSNVAVGTLAGLDASASMAGIGTKTGTVRDSDSNPQLGWIVAVDEDRVAVMTRAGRAPRTFLDEFRRALDGVVRPGSGVAEISIREAPAAACAHGWIAGSGRLRSAAHVGALAPGDAAICLGGAWADPGDAPRRLAGVLRRDGKVLVLETTAARWATGVADTIDPSASGEARAKLLELAIHDLGEAGDRHRGRLCDDSHCLPFRGTGSPRDPDLAAIGTPTALPAGWIAP